jgi:corrinoid protein of di/trimethylamine methyltransferase
MDTMEIIRGLETAVTDGDVEAAKDLALKTLELKIDALQAIEEGLIKGIRKVGDAFGKGEVFLPDLILSGEAMKVASDILEEELKKTGIEKKTTIGTIVIGTVKGDIHDIGKTLVAILLKADGFTVIDLGVDVSKERFLEAVTVHKADIIGLSSLLTSSAGEQKVVIESIKEAGLRSSVKIMVGGGAINEEWALSIGADAYGGDAHEAVEKCNKLLGLA